ncbi:MAG: DNA repair protein RecN [Christensenellaceae bacterium]|jgi:DNA repair protein RecN (Recombination protein N)|nr:DNA repair protein RecN [Christensenellaceae bacterium]
MLKSLHIQNIALITDLEIEFGAGLNVLTGETGAGKSIIIGGLNFILGGKLDKSVIRQGATQARVDAVFMALGTERNKITDMTGVEFSDNTVILSRILKSDGKSDCRIGGTVVTTDMLRNSASILINIHGQHETETLLKPKNHVAILDSFGGQKIIGIRNDYGNAVSDLNDLKKQLKTFGGDDFERKRLIDMYEYQIRDIEGANLKRGEDEELIEKKSRMQNFEKIKTSLGTAASVQNNIGEVLSALSSISHTDSRAERFYDTAKSINVEFEDLIGDITSYYDNLEFDEDEFKRVDARLDEIKILKRKYGNTIVDIVGFMNEAKANLERLTLGERDAERIKAQLADKEKTIQELGDKLIEMRTATAKDMEKQIVEQLRDLGMPHSDFRVDDISVDSVNFLFSANQGQNLRPLVHIISGGEMSRFMLALKAVTANIEGVGTIVFDEIDTGISGIMGHKIAEKMAVICRFTQVVAVTHLAQIASTANKHFHIHKEEENGKTTTTVTLLDEKNKKLELTRMIGGEEFLKNLKS